jgi:hypothetical protein
LHGGWLGQVIIDDDPYAVSLRDLDRVRRAAVETPQVNGFVGRNLLFNRLRDEVKNLDSVINCERQMPEQLDAGRYTLKALEL